MTKRAGDVDGPQLEKRQKVTLQAELELRYGRLTLEDMSDVEKWELSLPLPYQTDYNFRCSFDYMGRLLTLQVISFILQPLESRRLVADFAPKKYITGAPGYGKSVSVAVAVGYLLARSLQDQKQRQESEQQAGCEVPESVTPAASVLLEETNRCQEKTEAEQESTEETNRCQERERKTERERLLESTRPLVADLSDSRFLLLRGVAFVGNPARTFYEALALAYVHCDELPADSATAYDFSRFFRARQEKVYVVVDDGNAMDMCPEDNLVIQQAKANARTFLDSLGPCSIIICGPVPTSLRYGITKTPNVLHLYCACAGGFTGRELKAYLRHNGKTMQDLDVYKTGSVPRLVDQYLFDQRALERSILTLERQLIQLFDTAEGWQRSELIEAVVGGPPVCMDWGCLTGYLHSLALGLLAQGVLKKQVQAEQQISLFTHAIPAMRNMCAIGWNAEEAVILALRLLDVDIAGVEDVRPRPVSVQTITEITPWLIRTKVATLFVPRQFNHIGANIYYADESVVIVFQISVAKNAVKLHSKTREVAREILGDPKDKRRKLLVWVLPQELSEVALSPAPTLLEVAPSPARKRQTRSQPSPAATSSESERQKQSEVARSDAIYTELFTSFGDLHYSLECVDEVVLRLRGREHEVCRVCSQKKQGKQVACDFCNEWYHASCADYSEDNTWICWDCRVGYGLDES